MSPFDLYVRYLVSKGLPSVDDVNERLERISLPEIDQEAFDAAFDLIEDTVPRGILAQIEKKSYGSDFLRWMKVLEIDELWYQDKPFKVMTKQAAIKLAMSVHDDPKLRLSLNALLMKGVQPADICQSLNTRFAAMLTDLAVLTYEKFFWNAKRMTRSEWRRFIKECSREETQIYYMALTEPLDVLKTELELPAKVNVCDSIQYLLSKSFLKAKQFLSTGSPEGNNEARAWIDSVIKLSEKYEKYRSTDREDFAKSLQMEFEFVDSQFATPDDDIIKELHAKGEPENPPTKKDFPA